MSRVHMVTGGYPADWEQISKAIRERDGQKCACVGECGAAHPRGRCNAPNGRMIRRDRKEPWLWSLHFHTQLCLASSPNAPGELAHDCGAIVVVLTVSHRDRNPPHCDGRNLVSMCQRCHLVYDVPQHRGNAADTRARKYVERTGQRELFSREGRPMRTSSSNEDNRGGPR